MKEGGFNQILAGGFCGPNNYEDATVIKPTGIVKHKSNGTFATFGETMNAVEKGIMEKRLQQTRHENSRDPLNDTRDFTKNLCP